MRCFYKSYKPTIMFNITESCNLHCPYCLARMALKDKVDVNFNLKWIEIFLRDFPIDHIEIAGDGEPTLDNRFHVFLEKHKDYPITVFTNGTQKDIMLDCLAKYPKLQFLRTTSFDDIENAHNHKDLSNHERIINRLLIGPDSDLESIPKEYLEEYNQKFLLLLGYDVKEKFKGSRLEHFLKKYPEYANKFGVEGIEMIYGIIDDRMDHSFLDHIYTHKGIADFYDLNQLKMYGEYNNHFEEEFWEQPHDLFSEKLYLGNAMYPYLKIANPDLYEKSLKVRNFYKDIDETKIESNIIGNIACDFHNTENIDFVQDELYQYLSLFRVNPYLLFVDGKCYQMSTKGTNVYIVDLKDIESCNHIADNDFVIAKYIVEDIGTVVVVGFFKDVKNFKKYRTYSKRNSKLLAWVTRRLSCTV